MRTQLAAAAARALVEESAPVSSSACAWRACAGHVRTAAAVWFSSCSPCVSPGVRNRGERYAACVARARFARAAASGGDGVAPTTHGRPLLLDPDAPASAAARQACSAFPLVSAISSRLARARGHCAGGRARAARGSRPAGSRAGATPSACAVASAPGSTSRPRSGSRPRPCGRASRRAPSSTTLLDRLDELARSRPRAGRFEDVESSRAAARPRARRAQASPLRGRHAGERREARERVSRARRGRALARAREGARTTRPARLRARVRRAAADTWARAGPSS
jgi:hypothetical protein